MDLNITERGNNAFHSETGSAVLFTELEKGKYLQAAYTPMNYPAWNVNTAMFMEDELRNHIMYNLDGWYVDKCQLDINIVDGMVLGADFIVEDIIEHVIKKAEDYDFNPAKTTGALFDAVTDSAAALEYTLTNRMHQECYEELFEQLENT